jgi:hypothetical protein
MHVTLLPPEPEAPPPLPDEPEMPPEETTPPLDEMAPPLPNTPETPPNALVPPGPESLPSQIEHGHGPMAGHSHPHGALLPPKPVIPPNAWPPLPEPPKPPDCTPPLPRPPEPPTPLLFPPLAPPASRPRLVRLQPSASNATEVDTARPSRVVRIDSSLTVWWTATPMPGTRLVIFPQISAPARLQSRLDLRILRLPRRWRHAQGHNKHPVAEEDVDSAVPARGPFPGRVAYESKRFLTRQTPPVGRPAPSGSAGERAPVRRASGPESHRRGHAASR